MATTKQIATLKKAVENIMETIAGIEGGVDTPLQKLEKRLVAKNDTLEKLNVKIAGGKSKIPTKDDEAKTKLEEQISELETKIASSGKDKAASKKLVVSGAEENTDAEEKPAAKAVAKKTEVETEVEKKPAAKAVAKKAVVETKPEKNIIKLNAAMVTGLRASCETAGVEWNDDFKKTFVKYVNDMDAATYSATTTDGHMLAYANTHKPAAAAAGGGSKPVKMQTSDQLHKQHKNLNEVSAGIYQHKTTGEQFTGPDELDDEDYEDATVNDEEFIVGQTTKRVYTRTDDETTNEFVGFWGVGKFYDASL